MFYQSCTQQTDHESPRMEPNHKCSVLMIEFMKNFKHILSSYLPLVAAVTFSTYHNLDGYPFCRLLDIFRVSYLTLYK